MEYKDKNIHPECHLSDEDSQITSLFAEFDPQMADSLSFLSTLERNLRAVEAVKEQNIRERRRTRRAVIAASLAGFLSGVIFTLLMPFLVSWLSNLISQLTISQPSLNIADFPLTPHILGWALTAAASLLIAYNTYEITLARQSLR